MKFHPIKFAFASAAAATLMAIIAKTVFHFHKFPGGHLFGHGWHHHGAEAVEEAVRQASGAPCCPHMHHFLHYVVNMTGLFLVVFAGALFFAWFYNFLVTEK